MTADIAASLAELLGPGDVVLLQGDLAAGKTFFTRHLVQELGTQDDISSPDLHDRKYLPDKEMRCVTCGCLPPV
jgi:tRNA A37 threonylcarbamoyladenosine biosynthesis protein TsaE